MLLTTANYFYIGADKVKVFYWSAAVFILLCLFYYFCQSFSIFYMSYLDHMTGFYLCFTILSLFGAIIHPRAGLLRKSTNVSINISDDLAIFGGSHLSLDSVTSMRSSLNIQPIRPIISTFRKPQSNSFLSQFRASVLKQVQLFEPIPVHVTERKPSNQPWKSLSI